MYCRITTHYLLQDIHETRRQDSPRLGLDFDVSVVGIFRLHELDLTRIIIVVFVLPVCQSLPLVTDKTRMNFLVARNLFRPLTFS